MPVAYEKDDMAKLAVALWLCTGCVWAQTRADLAVIGVLQQADSTLAEAGVLHRRPVSGEFDLVIALAGPYKVGTMSWFVWEENRKLGLFLQDRSRGDLVYKLAIAPGILTCAAARIERVTATDTVISCTTEKSGRLPHHKFVYDVHTKGLVSQFSYGPFAMQRVFAHAGRAVFVGTDSQRLLAVEFEPSRTPPFRILSETAARPWTTRVRTVEGWIGVERKPHLGIVPDHPEPFSLGRFEVRHDDENSMGESQPVIVEYRGDEEVRRELPQSSSAEFAAARPDRMRDGYSLDSVVFNERIGPWAVEGSRLWFGKTFYDGEGYSGVGGFGYFDAELGDYRLFRPPEIANWSVSAIDVEADAVWMALVNNGEWGGASGGLLRFDRQSETVQEFVLPDIATDCLHVGGDAVFATSFGIAIVESNDVKRYFVDRTSDGRWRVVLGERGP